LRAAALDEPSEKDEKGAPLPLGETGEARGLLVFLALGIVALGVWWGPLATHAAKATNVFSHAP